MTEHGDQLRTAFETHEHLAPDAAAVYGRVQELSRSYQRRRWGVQAGGAVLGVTLIAGGAVALPGLLSGQQPKQSTVGAATMPNMTPSAAPATTEPEDDPVLQKQWDAYFGAGYGYEDAVKLAKLWKSKDEIGAVKAEAGRRLLAGETLPIKPGPEGIKNSQVDAFFAAGYTYEDAAKLAKIWKLKQPYDAKAEGGKRLLAGKKLPVKPSGQTDDPSGTKEQARIEAFFQAGYDYNDAVKLAKLWKKSDPYQAKIEAGKRLLAGDTLPIKP